MMDGSQDRNPKPTFGLCGGGDDGGDGGDDDERLTRIWSQCWIDYPAGRAGLRHLKELYKRPKSYRPQCCLIVGEPAAGKTSLVRRFVQGINPKHCLNEEAKRLPVVYVQSPPNADSAALYANILRNVGAPFQPTWQVPRKQDLVLRILTNLGTRMLIVDELHSMLAGHYNNRAVFMNVLKFLSAELQIPIVGVGTRDVNRAIQTDQQFGNRFEPFVLTPFKPDKDYVRFMVQVCKHAHFDNIELLHEPDFVSRAHVMTEGLVGETWKLICLLIQYAETEGKGKLDMKTLDKIEWVIPSMRKKTVPG